VRRLVGAKPIGVRVIGAALLLGVAACGQGDADGTADVEAGQPAGFKATPEYAHASRPVARAHASTSAQRQIRPADSTATGSGKPLGARELVGTLARHAE
jgi:hypothetical protein